MAGMNSRWRKGAQRAVPNRMVDHPSLREPMSEPAFVQARAREREGWHRGARVFPSKLNWQEKAA